MRCFPDKDTFRSLASEHADCERTLAVPIVVRLLADQLTPAIAYRRLVVGDDRTAPSFLLESVEQGARQSRYSILSAEPMIEVLAREHEVSIHDRRTGHSSTQRHDDPLMVMRELSARFVEVTAPDHARVLPECITSGWVGYASYDTVRYAEPEKLSFAAAPADDRGLPDLHFAFYDGVVVFDHAENTVLMIRLALLEPGGDPDAAHDRATDALARTAELLQTHSRHLPAGSVDDIPADADFGGRVSSNLTRETHRKMVERAQEYIRAGDIFQVVLGQRFEMREKADPFDVYRALRAINPSPYMTYLQCEGVILIASSPEILCRVRREGSGGGGEGVGGAWIVTNRPLAGTRGRGRDDAEDAALERELLSDAKECAEHAMLVDLGRNDVGRVAVPRSVEMPALMQIERYSHVMHISSTVTGELRDGLGPWDALRAALPVGTISGAPKIRAMQIIDELEPLRRGPYGGGLGYVSIDGHMDIALALRTIVVPTALRDGQTWTYHMQASGGIVAESVAEDEYAETVNKAKAMERAVAAGATIFGSHRASP